MKEKYLRMSLVLALLVFASIPAWAQGTLFKPFSSFRVIQTEHFDIIFPEESESSARLLASYADDTYRRMSSLLGIEIPMRVPVTFAPHTDLFNGYYSPLSQPHIVIYDTPMNPEWTTFADNLEGLFIHELMHAISLNSRGPFFRGLHRIFGNWVVPAFLNSPMFMVEGVTVSFESLSGFGRANDPQIKQYLRQAIHEDKFLTPLQASGVYDIPLRESFYEYGGLFSLWLIENYSMEKYAELWQLMGRDIRLSFSIYRSDFYQLFKRVYDMEFLAAWDAFRDSLALDGIQTNSDELLPQRQRFFSERRNFYQALAANGNELYFIDRTERKIRIYDTQTGGMRSFNSGLSAYDLDVAADGRTVLVSGYRLVSGIDGLLGSRHAAVVNEYRADSGRRTGRTIQGLYKARYFRDGLIGIRSELHNTLIVYEEFDGRSEVLFRGNQNLMFSGPQALDNERIVFIAVRDGIRELWLYNYVSGELFRIENTSGGGNFWRHMRTLGVSEGKIFFSHNADDRMYKLASVDLQSMRAVFSQRDFSGGVFYPVSINGHIYYQGTFTAKEGILRFPETADAVSGLQSALTLVRLNNEASQAAPPPPPDPLPSSAYLALRYMNPFSLWLPLPLIRSGTGDEVFGVSLDGGGFLSLVADPTDRNLLAILAYADIPYQMAMIDQLSWTNTALGFPLTAGFFDRVVEGGNNIYRSTGGSLGADLNWSMGQWTSGLSMGGAYVRNADQDGGRSAYEWEETESNFYFFAGLALNNRLLRLQLGGLSFVDSFDPRFDLAFRASMDLRFPLHFTLFGAIDARGMDLHAISNSYGAQMAAQYALVEYNSPQDLDLDWIVGGEIALSLFSFELQRNLSHAYFNRFSGTLALRSQIYDSKDHPEAEGIQINDLHLIQSLMLRLRMPMTFLPVVKAPLSVEPYLFGAWNFSNTITGDGSPFYIGLGFNIQL
ncbi:MAG: hypothetical protein FWH19_04540 [Treponema sp.]|nr:hypothetical protein [Treponema sp.]